MSASLIGRIPLFYTKAAEVDEAFDRPSRKILDARLKRENLRNEGLHLSCHYNLFFGFFFDGTRNNYMKRPGFRGGQLV